MTQSKSCEDCGQGCHCKEAYERFGSAEGPPITRDVSLAFLLPIVVFVIFLGAFGWLLKGLVDPSYQAPLAAGMALPATAALMLTMRFLMRWHRKK